MLIRMNIYAFHIIFMSLMPTCFIGGIPLIIIDFIKNKYQIYM